MGLFKRNGPSIWLFSILAALFVAGCADDLPKAGQIGAANAETVVYSFDVRITENATDATENGSVSGYALTVGYGLADREARTIHYAANTTIDNGDHETRTEAATYLFGKWVYTDLFGQWVKVPAEEGLFGMMDHVGQIAAELKGSDEMPSRATLDGEPCLVLDIDPGSDRASLAFADDEARRLKQAGADIDAMLEDFVYRIWVDEKTLKLKRKRVMTRVVMTADNNPLVAGIVERTIVVDVRFHPGPEGPLLLPENISSAPELGRM